MSIAWTDVVAIAPETAKVAKAGQDSILAMVAREVNAAEWGNGTDDASCYLAAHLATIGPLRRGVGALTSETVGPISQSYAAPPVMLGALGQTAYGAEFERRLYQLPAALGIVP